MLEETTPGEPGTEEPIPPHGDSAAASASRDDASAQGEATPASSGSLEATTTSQMRQDVWKTKELVRLKDGSLGTFRFELSAPFAATSILQKMIARGDYTREPWERVPLPTGTEAYDTTGDLFAKIKRAFKEQTHLSDKNCALLTFWVISTWHHVALPLAPGLAITGSAHDADIVLRTLRAFCYHPVLLVGMTSATLDNIRWQLNPTLLITEPALSTRMAALLGSSTGRGYLARTKSDGCPTSPLPITSPPRPFTWAKACRRIQC